MFGAENLFADCERALERCLGVGIPPQVGEDVAEAVQGGCGDFVICAEGGFRDSRGFLSDWQGFAVSTLVLKLRGLCVELLPAGFLGGRGEAGEKDEKRHGSQVNTGAAGARVRAFALELGTRVKGILENARERGRSLHLGPAGF